MTGSQGLTVGLAVGIPSFVIITFVAILWIRNQRKQKKEDLMENEIDVGLRDNASFDQFQQELHRPYHNKPANPVIRAHLPTAVDPNRSISTTHGDSADKPYFSSNASSSSTNTVDQLSHTAHLLPPANPRSASTTTAAMPPSPHRHAHIKTGSAYDFYDSFIPVLPSNHTTTPSSATNLHEYSPPQPTTTDVASSNVSSNNVSLVGVSQEKSLDNLAKQLTTPVFFEKLPSRAATVVLKPRGPASFQANNNSSSDLLANRLVNDTAGVNEHFVHEAAAVDTHRERQLHRADGFDRTMADGPFTDSRFDSSESDQPSPVLH